MIHFETYNVTLYKQIAPVWTEKQENESTELIEDKELCGLLELVTVMYLRQSGSLADDLIVGVESPMAPELKGYKRPFMTSTADDVLPLLRQMVTALDAMEGVREIDAETRPHKPRPNRNGLAAIKPEDDEHPVA